MVNLNSMKDFIFFATADWDTPYLTNKQHMAKEFARIGHRILYIESVGIRKPKIISGIDLKRIFFRFFRGVRGPKKVDANTNVWVLAPLVFPFGHGNKWIKLFNQSVMKWQMNCFLKQYGFFSPFIWTYHPYILDVIKNLGIRNKLIYHCVDDLSAVPGIDPLVAGTHLGVLLAFGLTLVDALGDVGRLLREQVGDEDLVGVEDVVVVHVADLADGRADDFLEINLRLRGEFAGDDDVVALDQGLAGDAGETVLREARIEDGVRDAVGDLIGVALADGFGREDVGGVGCHKVRETKG